MGPVRRSLGPKPELIFGATSGARPRAPGARRGPKEAENMQKTRGRIYQLILPKVCPAPQTIETCRAWWRAPVDGVARRWAATVIPIRRLEHSRASAAGRLATLSRTSLGSGWRRPPQHRLTVRLYFGWAQIWAKFEPSLPELLYNCASPNSAPIHDPEAERGCTLDGNKQSLKK